MFVDQVCTPTAARMWGPTAAIGSLNYFIVYYVNFNWKSYTQWWVEKKPGEPTFG